MAHNKCVTHITNMLLADDTGTQAAQHADCGAHGLSRAQPVSRCPQGRRRQGDPPQAGPQQGDPQPVALVVAVALAVAWVVSAAAWCHCRRRAAPAASRTCLRCPLRRQRRRPRAPPHTPGRTRPK